MLFGRNKIIVEYSSTSIMTSSHALKFFHKRLTMQTANKPANKFPSHKAI